MRSKSDEKSTKRFNDLDLNVKLDFLGGWPNSSCKLEWMQTIFVLTKHFCKKVEFCKEKPYIVMLINQQLPLKS